MILRPATRDEANRVVTRWHSHHKPVRAHRFAIAAEVDGVVVVASPVARALNDGYTFEVTIEWREVVTGKA